MHNYFHSTALMWGDELNRIKEKEKDGLYYALLITFAQFLGTTPFTTPFFYFV